jgi:hypothetical protein
MTPMRACTALRQEAVYGVSNSSLELRVQEDVCKLFNALHVD